MIILEELRCENCGRLLGKAIVNNGFLEIKCPKCGWLNKRKWFGSENKVGTTSGHSLHASNAKER